MIELVTAPWVRAFATPAIDGRVIQEFVQAHGLEELAEDDHTPIGRLQRQIDGVLGDYEHADLLVEFAGRSCYRAYGSGRSTEDYIKHILEEAHGNVLAHANVSFIVTGVSRALTHELIRHHVGTNPSQESQRYVTADGGEIEVIGYKAMRAVVPPLTLKAFEGAPNLQDRFHDDFKDALAAYHYWLAALKARLPGSMPATMKKKRANEAARCFLPNATETRLVWTMNLRAARNVIEQRGDVHADLEIRRLGVAFTRELKRVAPISVADAEVYMAEDGFEAVRTEHRKV